MTLLVNLAAGPCAGKSTMAAEIFAELKKSGHSAELVHEWIKGWAWEGRKPDGYADDIYIFAKQLKSESRLYGKVDFIVTDSPLELGVVYEALYSGGRHTIHDLLLNVRSCQRNDGIVKCLNLFVERPETYQTEGRFETHEQALKVDRMILNLFGGKRINSTKQAIDAIMTAWLAQHEIKDHETK